MYACTSAGAGQETEAARCRRSVWELRVQAASTAENTTWPRPQSLQRLKSEHSYGGWIFPRSASSWCGVMHDCEASGKQPVVVMGPLLHLQTLFCCAARASIADKCVHASAGQQIACD